MGLFDIWYNVSGCFSFLLGSFTWQTINSFLFLSSGLPDSQFELPEFPIIFCFDEQVGGQFFHLAV